MPLGKKKKTAAPKVIVKKKCVICGEEKNLNTDFYVSSSPLFEQDHRINICKNCFVEKCLNQQTGQFDQNATKRMLQKVDKPFFLDMIDAAKKEVLKNNPRIKPENIINYGDKIIKYYMKNVNTLRQLTSKTYDDSEDMGFRYSKEKVLTDDEKNSLIESKTWCGKYTQEDIDYLDNYYAGLERDYKIITENHRDYARKIAKASLQMDKAFNDMMAGEKNAEQKYKNAREAFDTLSKSAKFSESTRSVNDVGISSFSKVASMVEAHNWIPTHVPVEKDEIDKMIDYLSTITKSL